MSRSRLVVFSPHVWSQYSGSGKSALSLAVAIAARGHKVTILTYGAAKISGSEKAHKNIKVVRIPFISCIFFTRFILRAVVPAYIIFLAVRNRNLLVFGAFQGYMAAIVAARLVGMNTIFRSTMYGADNPTAIAIGKPLRKLFLSWANFYYPITPAFRNDYLCVYPTSAGKLLPIFSGVNTEIYKPISQQEKIELRWRLGVSINDFVIVSVGNLIPRKGYGAIFTALKEFECQFRYVILGAFSSTNNPLHKQSEKQAIADYGRQLLGNRVAFMGWVPNVHEYLQIADAYITNSNMEGLPNSLLEAMSTGVVVLVNRKLGFEGFLLDHFKNALVFDSPSEIPEMLTTLTANEPLRADLSKGARKTILDNYNLERVTRTIIGYLR